LLHAVSIAGQVKNNHKTSTKAQTTRMWHRFIHKELDCDRVAYYLPSIEDENVLLVVVCPSSKPGLASLNCRSTLYGDTRRHPAEFSERMRGKLSTLSEARLLL
ncbi:MAG TPA: hypothetical protein VI386_17330, partial [Candidatus Sulfotelmatobacter sp.]